MLYLVNLSWGRFFSLEKCIKFPPLKAKSYSNYRRGKFSNLYLESLLNSKAEDFFCESSNWKLLELRKVICDFGF